MKRTSQTYYNRKKSCRPGHSLSAPTEDMLFNLFRDACQAYCIEHSIERLPVSETEKLRKRWTAEALKVDEAPSWKALKNSNVDLLKPYLVLMADPTNETKRVAYANAIDEGKRRRAIKVIWENAKVIRMLQWLEKRDRFLLTDASINGYIETICEDQRCQKNWRELLLPFLTDHILLTVENRKRSHIRAALDAGHIIITASQIFERKTVLTLDEYIFQQAPAPMGRGISHAGRALNAMDGVPY
jgi:hypothetical protein